MGRIIDPYLVADKDEPGKWWCFDDNAANMSFGGAGPVKGSLRRAPRARP